MPNDRSISLTVFFPCYNEEENVGRILARALEIVPKVTVDYQIIIVNDGSRDNTALIAGQFAQNNENIEVISHKINGGYGAALRTGFTNAKKEYVFYTDGDNQFDLAELTNLIELIGKYDIISGYRINRQDPIIRKINAVLYNFALLMLFGLKIKDVDCAFKLYKSEIFRKISIESNGALVDAEILIKAKQLGYTIGQCGVTHYPRSAGKQTGANLKVIFRAFKEILKLRFKI